MYCFAGHTPPRAPLQVPSTKVVGTDGAAAIARPCCKTCPLLAPSIGPRGLLALPPGSTANLPLAAHGGFWFTGFRRLGVWKQTGADGASRGLCVPRFFFFFFPFQTFVWLSSPARTRVCLDHWLRDSEPLNSPIRLGSDAGTMRHGKVPIGACRRLSIFPRSPGPNLDLGAVLDGLLDRRRELDQRQHSERRCGLN
jgi:hypothetical protein